MTNTLTIEYGADLLLNLGVSPAQFDAEAKFLLAAKLYELSRLTAGQAAHRGKVKGKHSRPLYHRLLAHRGKVKRQVLVPLLVL